jgi:mycothiol S-conjugate amidase
MTPAPAGRHAFGTALSGVDAANEPLRLVWVLTHQDDEPGEGAATLARYVSAGHEVMVVTCTGHDGEAAVIEAIGVGHHWLGYPDSGRRFGGGPTPQGRFASVPIEEPTERLVRVLREFRPHVVVVYNDSGDAGDPDPDRLRCLAAAAAAFDAAGDAIRFPTAGEPWQPPKLYTAHEWCEARMRALHEALLSDGLTSPYHEWLTAPVGGAKRITTRVPCGEYFPVREKVLRAHAGRLDAECHWFAVPMGVRQAVWPTEDFELSRCYVATTLPEDDLFAGIS